jgi:dolichol-phosphate mannosyltransferase
MFAEAHDPPLTENLKTVEEQGRHGKTGRVTVILPTLDEVATIDGAIAAVLKACEMASLDFEVLVVDDASTDGTRERVRAWESDDRRVHLLVREGERGLAGAVLAGARFASGDVVVVMDADLSHPPEAVPALVRPVLQGSCDMVIGSRYVPGGATPGWSWSRRVLSRGAAVLARVLVDARDPCSGFFAVRKETLLEMGTAPGGFKIGLELLARSRPGHRVKEIPITFRPRAGGCSKLGAREVLAFLAQLVDLAGGTTSVDAVRYALAGTLGLLLDIALFHGLLWGGFTLGVSHLTSFAAGATAGCLLGKCLGFRREGDARGPAATLTSYAALAVVALLAVFLRGGVLALTHRSLGLPPGVAIVPAAVVATIVNLLGAVFFASRTPGPPKDPRISWRAAAVGVSVYLLAIRCVYVAGVELIPQEAYYWNYSQHLDLSYLDHPPMVAWLIWLGTSVFGQTELGVRAGALGASLIALWFSVRLAGNLLGRPYAYPVALLFAVLPFFFGTGFFMTPDAPLVACWAGALYFLERGLLAGSRRAWLGAGIVVGLGLLSKYTIALVAIAALAYMLLDRRARRWLFCSQPYVAILLALLLVSPVLLWNAQHGWASFIFQGPQRWGRPPTFDLPELFWNVLILITPPGVAGVAWGLSRSSPGQRFGLVFTLVPLSVFVLSSLRHETKFNWTGPVWLVALPFMAASLFPAAPVAPGWLPGRLQRLGKLTVLALMLFYGALLHYGVLGLPGVPEPIGHLGRNWRELGRRVEEIEAKVRERTGQTPLVVGMDKYNLASVLAFYAASGDGSRKTTTGNLFGRQGLMYDFWFPPDKQIGKSLILVSTDPRALEASRLGRFVDGLEPVHELRVERHDVIGAQYFLRVAHGYRGPGEPSAGRWRGGSSAD